MPSRREVDRLRAANARITRLAERDLRSFWGTLDLSKPKQARDALLDFVPTLTDTYGDVAATVAADWYDEVREAAEATGSHSTILAGTEPTDHVQQRTRFGAQHLFTETPDQSLVFLVNATSKYVLQPGRDTIAQNATADRASDGWRRVARPGSCKFCRMLEGRGAVYKEATADFASHGACHCAAVPEFGSGRDEVDTRLYVASQRTSRMSPAALEAHRERVRDWLADMPA